MTDEPELADYPKPAAEYLAALAEGRFILQRCKETGRFVFFPRAISPWSGQPTLEWVEASGEGTVYSSTVVRRRPEQGGDYNVALIDLAEGPRMMSRVEDIDPPAVAIGMAVEAFVGGLPDKPVLLFRPRSAK
jgi:hypothetical protein